MVILVPLTVILSLRLVFWSSDESAQAVVSVLAQNRQLHEHIQTRVPLQGIVFTDRSDKIFFPAREVVTRFRTFDQSDFAALYPYQLYYETIADTAVVAFENDRFWGPHGLRAVDPVDLGYRHTLYKLEVRSQNVE